MRTATKRPAAPFRTTSCWSLMAKAAQGVGQQAQRARQKFRSIACAFAPAPRVARYLRMLSGNPCRCVASRRLRQGTLSVHAVACPKAADRKGCSRRAAPKRPPARSAPCSLRWRTWKLPRFTLSRAFVASCARMERASPCSGWSREPRAMKCDTLVKCRGSPPAKVPRCRALSSAHFGCAHSSRWRARTR